MGVVKEVVEMKKGRKRQEVTTAGVMAAMEVMDVTCTTLSKVAMRGGMNSFVFVVYTHGLGALLHIPLSLLYHWRVSPPRLTLSVLLRILLLSFIAYCYSLFLFIGVGKSSPTLASAIINLSPAFTFILAILFRMEVLDLRVGSSLFKSAGTIVSIAGAFVVIFYQGWPILLFPAKTSSPPPPPPPSSSDHRLLELLPTAGEPNWILGGLFVTASTVFFSLTLIIKAWILRDFPSELLLGLITNFFHTLFAVVVALLVVRDPRDWSIGFDQELITIIFMAIFIVVVLNSVHSWGCRTKGAVYVAMFKPLQMIIAVLFGVSFLGDTLHFGSIVGGTTIALGFYMVMRGKYMEDKDKVTNCNIHYFEKCDPQEMQDQEVPLLMNKV